MKLLITGFEPFGGEKINPSWEAVKKTSNLDGVEIIQRCLPVEWSRGQQVLIGEINAHKPDCVLMTGQAGGRKGVTIERIAINLCEAAIGDNTGAILSDTPIEPQTPAAYFTTLPYKEMLGQLLSKNIDAAYSFSAGAYLCNCAMYRALHMQDVQYPHMRAGFIHLPYLPEQTEDKPSMPLEAQAAALDICIRAIAQTQSREEY